MKYLLTGIFTLFFLPVSIFAQALPIGIDGQFNDWNEYALSHSDDLNDGSTIDFISLQVSNDEDNLYIRFEIAEEVLLNEDHQIRLQMDTDNNPETGYQINGIGAELGWLFASRQGYFTNPSGSSISVEHSDIGFMALPTVSANEFELAISRNALVYGDEVFPGNTIKLFLYDSNYGGDYIPNEGECITYTFDDESSLPAFAETDLNRETTSDIRIMTYNTLFDGLIDPEREDKFMRILQAVNPDIVTFNEAWDTQAYDVQSLMNDWLPLTSGAWSCVEIDNGNITCTRWAIDDTYRIMPGNRLSAVLIDLPEEYGSDLLSINAHFKCCGGASNNAERQKEADAFAAFILDAKSPGGYFTLPENTPFVLSGDLNLVGYSQQLTTLLTGDIQNTGIYGQGGPLDWDNSDLTDQISSHTDDPHAYTWWNQGSSYWPGRLDYIIYSDAVLQNTHAYTLDTRLMSPLRLSQFGLQYEDSEASDHLPKVADFQITDLSGTAKIENSTSHFALNADTAGSGIYTVSAISDNSINSIILTDMEGRQLLHKNVNAKEFLLNMQAYASGVYLLKIKGKGGSETIKFIHQR